MQIEVKLLLRDGESYQRTLNTLANHRLKTECYYDIFFDFPIPALQERNSMLRLRVPCDPACINSRPETSAPDARRSDNSNYDPEEEYEALMRACRGEGSPVFQGAGDESIADCRHAARASSGVEADSGSLHGLPVPTLIPGANGKLVLKQKNTIEQGHQLSFVIEDAQVPPTVVEALVRLVPESLFAGALPDSRGVNGNFRDIFPILSDYAEQQRRLGHGSGGDSAMVRILHHLADVACSYAVPNGAAASAVGLDSSNAHFSQLRFASMGASAVYPDQRGALSRGIGSEEKRKLGEDGGGGAEAPTTWPQLVAVAGFMTLRKVFAYAPLLALQQGTNGALELTTNEMEFREGLRIRLDVSYILPGLTIYELEVPKCGVAVDEVTTEVSNFLRSLSVSFDKGSESKFARYMQYLCGTRDAEQNASDVKLRLTNVHGYEEVRRNLEQFILATSAANVPSSQDQRPISNTEVISADGADAGDATDLCWRASCDGYLQEANEDFFFDSPEQALRRGHSFLRLRKQHRSNKFVLALKAHQAFSGGHQSSLSSKVSVCETVARALIDDPTKFLHEHAEHLAVMRAVWGEFRVRALVRTATFTTERLTVPWWSAQAQQSTFHRNWTNGALSTAPQHSQLYPLSSYCLSQQQQHSLGVTATSGPAMPLLIHLDKTVYKLPAHSQAPRIPFSPSQSWGARQCEMYEMEVTNIVAPTEPKDVVTELTSVLNGLGVEWSVGVRSKLEHYFSLVEV